MRIDLRRPQVWSENSFFVGIPPDRWVACCSVYGGYPRHISHALTAQEAVAEVKRKMQAELDSTPVDLVGNGMYEAYDVKVDEL